MAERRVLAVDASEKSIYVRDELAGEGGYWASGNEGFRWKWYFGPDKRDRYLSSRVWQIIKTVGQVTYMLCGEKVFKVTPDGKRSELKIPSVPLYLGASPSNSQVLYTVARAQLNAIVYPGILLKSEDGGFSWTGIDWKKSLQPERLGRGRWYEISLLAVDPQSPNILYITVGPEDDRTVVLKTSDGGSSWIEINVEGEPKSLVMPESLSVDPSNSNIIYLQRKYDLLRSNDGGKTLKSIKPEVEHIYIYGVAVDALMPTVLYLATDTGIYRSSDSGNTWKLFNLGILDTKVRRIITSSFVTLAEGDNGIYRLLE